jgi:hypothetical protein
VIKNAEYAQEIEKCKEKLEHGLKRFEVREFLSFPLIAWLTLTVQSSIVSLRYGWNGRDPRDNRYVM